MEVKKNINIYCVWLCGCNIGFYLLRDAKDVGCLARNGLILCKERMRKCVSEAAGVKVLPPMCEANRELGKW